MRRLLVPGLLLAALLLPAGLAPAGEPKPEPSADDAKAAALVEKLGADSFEVREDAYARLQKMGKAAVKALEEGTKHKDKEVSERCKRLLALATRPEVEVALDALLHDKDSTLVLKLPSYERFKKLFGDDPKARTLFVEVYTREGDLLAGLERDPKQFEQAFLEHCRKVQQDVLKGYEKNQLVVVPMGQLVALLFAATDPRASANRDAFVIVAYLLTQKNLREGVKESAAAGKLLADFLKLRVQPGTMVQAMDVATEFDLKDLAGTALKTATDKTAPAYMRGACLVALGHLGTKEHRKDVEPLLEDATHLGNLSFRNATVTAELRDAALGALILLSGQDLQDYDFPYLKATKLPKASCRSYTYFGFSDDKQRAAALKKFKESRAKEAEPGEKK
jgi:hypothetical protein